MRHACGAVGVGEAVGDAVPLPDGLTTMLADVEFTGVEEAFGWVGVAPFGHTTTIAITRIRAAASTTARRLQ